MAGWRDLAVATFVAIGQSGTRRDFIDLHILLDRLAWDLAALVAATEEKFPGQPINLMFYLKALTYFDDAEVEPMPMMLVRLSWRQVRQAMERRVRAYIRELSASR